MERPDNLSLKHLFTSWFTLVPDKTLIKLCKTNKFYLSCSVEMYHSKELPKCAKQNIEINKLQHFAKYLNYFWCKIFQKAFYPCGNGVLALIIISSF